MSEPITIVSGLPRTGTSMMMRMLEAGGIDVITDYNRKPDVDNPGGYYELEKVKKIEQDKSWLADARGKAFKMIATLLVHLPPMFAYQVIFMQRDMREMLRSQNKMLDRLGQPTPELGDIQLANLFQEQLEKANAWISSQPNVRVIFIRYRDVLSSPRHQAKRINSFLEHPLSVEGMALVVEPSLYRNKF